MNSSKPGKSIFHERPRAAGVQVTDESVVVTLTDERVVHIPIKWLPSLLRGTPKQRENWEFIGRGYGIHWPELDEDVSIEAILNPFFRNGRPK